MGSESFDVIRFDLGPIFQGQMRIAKISSAYISFIRFPRGLQCHQPIGNLLIWSDFTLGSSFKVKRCLNGFGEFSFWWIQFAPVLRCDRSSFYYLHLSIIM